MVLRLRFCHARVLFPLVMMLLVADVPLPGQETGSKAPVPGQADQEKALKIIREIYKEDYDKAKTAAEKQALAKRLLQQAVDTKGDPASRFVLFRLAREIATEVGDGQTAFEAVDGMAAEFRIDAVEMKTGILATFTKTARLPIQQKAIAERAMSLIGEALAQDNFAVARQLVEIASSRAKAARDRQLIRWIHNWAEEVETIAEAHAEVKVAMETLQQKPADPQANFLVGRYLCFIKGDWQEGVPMLALGSDAASKSLAVKELKGVASHADEAALGDGWWDLAGKEEGRVRKQLLARAGHWYQRSLPALAGLPLAKVEKRLAEIFVETAPESLYLSEIEPREVRAFGRAPVPLSVGGVTVFHGLWAHPIKRRVSSRIALNLHKAFRELRGVAGISDGVERSGTPLTFRIVGDGVLLWKSGRIQRRGDRQPFRVKISGVEKLELFVDCPGSNANAHAVWVDPVVGK